MIEQYAFRVTGLQIHRSWGRIEPAPDSDRKWDAAKADYDASPVRGKAFCTLPRQEQVDIVRKYVNR